MGKINGENEINKINNINSLPFIKSILHGKKSKSGVTLIEIIIAIAILGIIAAPLLSLFAVSTQNTVISANITTASYICQSEMEQLMKLDYLALLDESKQYYDSNNTLIKKTLTDGSHPQISYTIRIYPAGVHNDLLATGETASYMHMLLYNKPGNTTTTLSLLFPDGRSDEITPIGTVLDINPVSSSAGYTHNIYTGNPAITSFFKVPVSSRLMIITNLSRIDPSIQSTSINLSHFSSSNMPKVIYYATDKNILKKFTIIPVPTQGATQNFVGGDLYDEMLVTIEITAYFQIGQTLRAVASIHDTISPRIIITTP